MHTDSDRWVASLPSRWFHFKTSPHQAHHTHPEREYTATHPTPAQEEGYIHPHTNPVHVRHYRARRHVAAEAHPGPNHGEHRVGRIVPAAAQAVAQGGWPARVSTWKFFLLSFVLVCPLLVFIFWMSLKKKEHPPASASEWCLCPFYLNETMWHKVWNPVQLTWGERSKNENLKNNRKPQPAKNMTRWLITYPISGPYVIQTSCKYVVIPSPTGCTQ